MFPTKKNRTTLILILVVISLFSINFAFRAKKSSPENPTYQIALDQPLSKNWYQSKKDTFLISNRTSGSVTKGLTQNDSNRMTPVAGQQLHSVKVMNGSTAKLTACLAAQQQGIIGLFNESQLDNPADNIFTVTINNQLNENDRVWLTYNLTGLDDYSNVACSVNDRLAMGGYLAKKNSGTHRQRVQLNAAWIQKGENRIQFGIPENADYGYKISDLSIEVEKVENDSPLIVNAGSYLYDSKAYIHGFMQRTTGDKAIVSIEGKPVTLRDGEFETIVTLTGKQMVEVRAQVNGKAYLKEIRFNSNTQPDHQYVLNESTQKTSKTFQKGVADILQTENAQLKVDDKALLLTQKLSLTTLRNMDLPALDMGMTNVTGNNKGFRFLPHGEHFTDGATVALKYDKAKIPDGYTENDIKSFYFDTHTNHWVALERDTVDKALCMVVSKTTHFTDMINGIIKTPESPQTEGFTPTMMNGIKAADPTSKIELIAPPTANNFGSANLSYSLEMPPARNGMSPNLAIQYNSDGGSGWLGEGWDLNVPSITVDTRWGVPRYDTNFETETYSMGGTMLATVVSPVGSTDSLGNPSVSHRGKLYERRDSMQFHPVVENGFSKIVRYGKDPYYYWVVTDKNGVSYLYGANTRSDHDNIYNGNQDILTGQAGTFQYTNKDHPEYGKDTLTKIVQAEWKLSEVIDLHGFFNKYSYDKITDTIANNVLSKRLVLREIGVGQKGYNGSPDSLFYRIRFAAKTKKIKQQNNGRYGFLVSGQNTLLDSVIVYSDTLRNGDVSKANNIVRAYAFSYKTGAFNTELVEKLIQLDDKKREIASHNFGYFNTISNNSQPDLYNTSPIQYTNSSLGSGHTNSNGWSAYVGIGVQLGIVSAEVGYQHAFGNTQSYRDITLIDINGDGLPDKVFKYTENGNDYFGFMPNNGLGGFGNVIQIVGAQADFSFTESKSYSDGWQGDVSAGLSKTSVGVNAGMDWTKTYSRTTAYFQDVNNDGLVDIVNKGQVYFNKITYQNGIAVPSFTTFSKLTQNPIKNTKTTIGESNVFRCQDPINRSEVLLTQEQLELIKRTPLQDVVRVWEAPYSGNIVIKGSVRLIPCNAPTDGVVLRIQYKQVDVRYSIINAGDSVQLNTPLTVSAGDRVYFRLQSGTGILSDAESDVITFSPTITYSTGIDDFAQPGYSTTVYSPLDAPMINKLGYNLVDTVPTIISGYNPATHSFQYKTILSLKGSFRKPVTTDSVKISIFSSNDSIYLADSIVVNKTNTDTTEIRYRVPRKNLNYQTKKVIWSKTYLATDNLVDSLNETISAIPLSSTQFWFEISSNTNVKWDEIKWNPELHFNSHGRDTVIYAGVKYNMFTKKISNGSSFTLSNDNCHYNNVSITPNFLFKPNKIVNSRFELQIRQKSTNKIMLDKVGTIVNNVVNYVVSGFDIGEDDLFATIFINDTSDVYDNVALTAKRSYKVNYGLLCFSGNDYVAYVNASAYRLRNIKEQDLGPMWRGWGQFEYNCSSQNRFMNPLVVDSLYIPTNINEMDSLRNPYIYRIVPETQRKLSWQGVNRQIFINGDTLSTGRNNIETMPDFTTLNSGASYIPAPPLTMDQLNQKLILINNRQIAFALPKRSNQNILFFSGKLIPCDINKNPVAVTDTNNPSTTNITISNPEADSLYVVKNAPVLSTTSESTTFWGGASVKIGIVSPGLSGSKSDGSSTTTMAFTDMNGDGYPDYITDDKIEYTNARGSRDGETKSIYQETTQNSSWSIGINGGFSKSESPNSGGGKMPTIAEMTANLYENPSPSASIGYSHSENDDQGTNSYIDVNGDGLPDRIFQTKVAGKDVFRVCLNLGYGFSPAMDYGLVKIQSGKTFGNSVAISGNMDAGYIGGGESLNHSWSTAKTLFALKDMNGDGLVDQIFIGNDNACYIAYNLGNRFTDPIKNDRIQFINETVSDGTGTNRNFKVTIPLWFFKITAGGSQNLGTTSDYISKEIQDIDGDGYPDLLSVSGNNVNVLLSTIGVTNKLQSVTNPLGGSFAMNYVRSKASNDHPGGKWVMSSVSINDGISDDIIVKDSFEYSGGKYDRYEREFLGFAKVKTNNINTVSSTNEVYRCTKQAFDTQNYYSKGNLLSSIIYEGDGTSNKKNTENTNEYYNYTVSRYIKGSPSIKGKFGMKNVNLTFDSIVRKQYIIYSPEKYAQSKIYGANDTTQSVTSQSFYDYNTYAGTQGELRLYKFSDKGGLSNTGSGSFNYMSETQYLKKNGMTFPNKHTVTGSDGNIIYRQVLAEWDTLYSNHLLKVKNVIAIGDTAITDFKYDRWGNIVQKILPANSAKQRMSYIYTYGNNLTFHQYLTQITDSYGYTSTLGNYNYKYGVPCKITDENNNVMLTVLDNLGRVASITGPNEYNPNNPNAYTLKFDYHPQVTTTGNNITAPAYATTKHFDPSNPNDDLETYTFTDGLGRAIQVKKDGLLGTSPVMIVSGRVKYDAFGRVKEAYYPITEGTGTKTTFNTAFDGITPAKTTYDILDRVLTTTTPDGKVDSMSYAIESGNLKTTVVDAMNGKQATYTNGSGQTVKTVQYSGPNGTIITGFGYDAINQLLTVADAMGNTTTSVYDMAGRRTQVTHPASGITKFVYDDAGNLQSKQTANLLKKNSQITYNYNYNRLTGISYPDHPENNVSYTYGASGATDNRAGRLVYQIDGSGGQEFKYGKMGEMTELRRTLMIPNQAVATYVTNWTYDCWDRIQNMTYPDGEKLTYMYNTAGLLTGVAGTKGSDTYIYVKNIGYDKFEQRASMQYGNGTGGNGAVTTYTYNPQTRLLSNLQVLANNTSIMNNGYMYDAVRNVTDVKNTGVPSANQLGGQMEHIYTYDGLYRLKTGTGIYSGRIGMSASYTLAMSYDNLHNITGKKQDILQNNVQFTGALHAGYKLSYNYAANSQQISNIADSSYRYATGESQAARIKTQDYGYDANGNLVYVNTGQINTDKTFTKSNERKLLWDEENRLLALSDNGFVSNYWYDAAGDRTVKESGVGQGVSVNGLLSGGITGTTNFTTYISPYLVLNNGGYYTKHIYMGSQRIVSKLGSSDIFTVNPTDASVTKAGSGINYTTKYADLTGKIKTRYDSLGVTYRGTDNAGAGMITSTAGKITTPQQYFFHSDHLGSSSLITDILGNTVQHLEYIPFGEVFIDERAATSTWSTPYKFNAKELDEETGLYYYGARYYDPRTSVWISVDPLAEKYPNVSSYVYCHNNPVNMVDPDGKADKFTSSGRFEKYDGIDDGKILVKIGASYVALSKLDYSKHGTAHAVTNIIAHYASEEGYSGTFGIQGMDEGGFTTESGSVFLSANEFKKGSYDNSFWLKSVLGHEADPNNGHKSESLNLKHNYTYMAHAGVYFEQGRTSVFAKLDENGKYTVASAFTDRIWNAFVNGEIKSEQIKTYINAFNTKNTGGVTINAGLITIGNNISGMRFNISVGEKQSPNESAKTLKNPHQ